MEIFQRRHPCCLFKLLGKILKGAVGEEVCDFRKVHGPAAHDLLGTFNFHHIEIIYSSAVLFSVKQGVKGGTAYGEFIADGFNGEMLADVKLHKLNDLF